VRKTCARRRNTSLRSTRVTPISAQRSYPISYIFRTKQRSHSSSYPTQAAILSSYDQAASSYPIDYPLTKHLPYQGCMDNICETRGQLVL